MAKTKYTTNKELVERIDDYFNSLEETGKLPTITGLAYHLGFSSRQSIYEYQENPTFGDSVKRARLAIEASLEQYLLNSKTPAGIIFSLKNMGWSDQQKLDITTNGQSIGVVKLPSRG